GVCLKDSCNKPSEISIGLNMLCDDVCVVFIEVKYTINEFCEYPHEVNNRFKKQTKDMLNEVQELQKDIEELENFYWYIDYG
ncbi:25079_t:CDS:2, partial [Racocetra persica]